MGLGGSWIDPIKAYIQTGWLPNDVMKARKLVVRALRYSLIDGILYKRFYVVPYLRCLRPDEARLALEEVHEASRDANFYKFRHSLRHVGNGHSCALSHVTSYGIPRILITDNGTQFNNEEFRKCCGENEIELRFTSVAYPQANGQPKVANRIILDGLK
ncbi:uncharacterized protein LOC141679652 [Apium graveolens]|uniref:uncharacterized protein LOC141679652 n=1 Tax=Apium graveolens TaxID=4045 RepID=UPI003D7BA5EA